MNYLPVITRLFHDYLPDCLAGLDDVEAGGQIAAVQAGDKAEVVQQPSVGVPGAGAVGFAGSAR